MDRYRIRVSKDYLSFCSAHFIIFNETQCERLHGHNYRVEAELEGTLDQDLLVFDFIELKLILKSICEELDHRVLVPVESRTLDVDVGEARVAMRYEDREWVFPRGDCALLPIENTTAELLARWFARRLRDALKSRLQGKVGKQSFGFLRVELFESPGQSAEFRLENWLDAEER